jgi:hypothetical protein
VKEHIPKKHLQFEEPIRTDKRFDNTHDRIYGQRRDELMLTENFHYGKAKNAADDLPSVGKRTQLMEREVTVTCPFNRFICRSSKKSLMK